MSVRVWEGGFMVDTLGHLNFGPNVVFETVEPYISSVPSSMGGHGRTPGGHGAGVRGQSPRTDFGPDTKSSPLTTPPGSLKLRLFGH